MSDISPNEEFIIAFMYTICDMAKINTQSEEFQSILTQRHKDFMQFNKEVDEHIAKLKEREVIKK